MATLDSRQRLLRAINLQDVDYLPCCLMSFAILRKRKGENWFEVAKSEMEMGLDPMLFLPTASRLVRKDHPDLRGLPVRFHPDVKLKEWWVGTPDELGILHKQYDTPAGKLTTSVRLSEDWPHGSHIPFVDDYQVPRAIKSLVTEPKDLEALQFMLTDPAQDDIAQYQQDVKAALSFTEQYPVLLTGGWGVGMDMANWLCGMQNLMMMNIEQPKFIDDLLEMIHTWNKKRMAVILSAPIDLFIRRSWYEGCDFVTPRFYRQSILPRLKAEVDLAHEHGVKFGYICSSGTKPMLDLYLEAGIDVLLGIDPIQGTHTDMPLLKQKLGQRICLWGGVSAAVTVERGSEAEVRQAVRAAIQILGKRGFILSPIDNLTVDKPLTWENLQHFIDEWRRCR